MSSFSVIKLFKLRIIVFKNGFTKVLNYEIDLILDLEFIILF